MSWLIPDTAGATGWAGGNGQKGVSHSDEEQPPEYCERRAIQYIYI